MQEMSAMMQQFEKESTKMEMSGEMMDDVLDDVLGLLYLWCKVKALKL